MCTLSETWAKFGPLTGAASMTDGSGVLPPKHHKANPRSKGHLQWDLGSSPSTAGLAQQSRHFCNFAYDGDRTGAVRSDEVRRGLQQEETAVTRGATPNPWQALESPATATKSIWGMSQASIKASPRVDAEATDE